MIDKIWGVFLFLCTSIFCAFIVYKHFLNSPTKSTSLRHGYVTVVDQPPLCYYSTEQTGVFELAPCQEKGNDGSR